MSRPPMRSAGSRGGPVTAPDGLDDPLSVMPLTGPVDADVVLPGSKSVTNRALVAAALADGSSTIHGALTADDTEAMTDCLVRLRAHVVADPAAATLEVGGLGGRIPDGSFTLDARLSGTTARFVLPLLALGPGHYRLDGSDSLRRRPMAGGLDALRALGATVHDHEHPGHLPVTVEGGPRRGGSVSVPGDVSSQFLSGLLLAAPAFADGLTVRVTTPLVSRPYVAMTVAVMSAFGVEVAEPDPSTFVVGPQTYRATSFAVEPDASAASYAWAAAALCGGRVRVPGLGSGSLQGDVAFADVLEAMGARVERSTDAIEVHGTGSLRGGTFDLSAISDTAQTLAAVAVYADGPTEVTGIGFIRAKETDRIAAVVAELRRCGIDASETADGFVVRPGTPRPAVVHTYDDHRMAMSFALLGLRSPGIAIADPGCVAKTFPGFWAMLDTLRSRSVRAGDPPSAPQ